MAEKRIELDDLIDPEALPLIKQQLQDAIVTIDKGNDALTEYAGRLREVFTTSNTLPESTEQVKSHTNAVKQSYAIEKINLDLLQKKIQYQTYLTAVSKEMREEEERALKLQTSAPDSLNRMRDSLNKLSKEIVNASAATREKLIPEYKKLNDEIKGIEQRMGNFQREVGNYGKATVGLKTKIQELTRGIGGLAGIFGELGMMMGLEGEQLDRLDRLSNRLVRTSREMSYEKNLDKLEEQEGIKVTEASTAAKEGAAAANEGMAASATEAAAAETVMMGPIGWITAGIVALGAVIGGAIGWFKIYRSELDETSKAYDGTIIWDKELRDEYNKLSITIGDLADKYEVLLGAMTDVEAKTNSLARTFKVKAQDITNAAQVNVNKEFSVWKDILSAITIGLYDQEEHANEIIWKAQEQIMNLKLEQNAELLELQEEHNKKMLDKYREGYKMIDELNNEMDMDDVRRQKNKLAIDQKYAEQEIDDMAITELEKKALKVQLETETAEKIAKIDQDEAIRKQKQSLQNLVDEAALTFDKRKELAAQYAQKRYNLEIELEKEGADAKERARRFGILAGQNKEAVLEYEKSMEMKKLEIQKEAAGLIVDVTARMYETVNTQYEIDSANFAEELRKKEITLEMYNQKIKDALEKRNTAIAEADNKALGLRQQYEEASMGNISARQNIMEGMNVEGKRHLLGMENPAILIPDIQRQGAEKNALIEAQDKATKTQAQNEHDTTKKKLDDEMDMLNKQHNEGLISEQEYQMKLNTLKDEELLNDDKLQAALQKNDDETQEKKLQNARETNKKILEIQQKEYEAAMQGAKQVIDDINAAQKDGLEQQDQAIATEQQTEATLFAAGRKNTLSQMEAAENEVRVRQYQQQQREKKEKEAEDLVETFEKSVVSFIEAGMSPESAMLKAAEITFAAKAMAAGIAGAFFKGTSDTGGPGKLDDKGGKLAILHPHEAVISREANERVPGLAKAWLEGRENEFIHKMFLPTIHKEQTAQEQIGEVLVGVMDKGFKSLEKTVSGQKQMVAYNTPDGPVVEEHTSGGRKTRVIKNGPVIRII